MEHRWNDTDSRKSSQWVLGFFLLQIQLKEHETNHSSPSSAQVKNCGAIPLFPYLPSCCAQELYCEVPVALQKKQFPMTLFLTQVSKHINM
jgi:hypothetical protein